MWPFYHLAFMMGTGFQSIFLIWPAASSWSAAADVPQPFVVAQLWLVAAQSCSQDGCWNAGMCNSAIAAGKPWSVMVWRAAEHWDVAGLLCEQLAPKGRTRAEHGSWLSFRKPWVWGTMLGPGWAATSAQPPAHHSHLLSWRGEEAATVSSSKGRKKTAWNRMGWVGRGKAHASGFEGAMLGLLVLGKLWKGHGVGRKSGAMRQSWGCVRSWGNLSKGIFGARVRWIGQDHRSQTEVPLQRRGHSFCG